MFEGAVAGLLNRLLGKYVQDLDTENLNVGIFSGSVNLTDLKLKPEALYELDLPIDVKIGTIGRINLQIPWAGLYTQPVIVNIEDVLILVGPAISNTHFDPEREKRLMRAAKRKILEDLEAESEIRSGPQNILEKLFTLIVNNLQIYVRNVHVRYEDSISSQHGPMACGLCLQSFSIETTNSKWKPSVTPAEATTVYQMLRVESLSVYWNPTATVLDDAETAHITPMQYYNWKHYMITGLDKLSMHQEPFELILSPVSAKVKVMINRASEARVPRLLIDAMLPDTSLNISRRQYGSIHNLAASLARIAVNRKYRHLHPRVPVMSSPNLWWKYAYNVVIEQRVRPYTWAAVKTHRQHYETYRKLYEQVLRHPNDTELKMDLQQCEDRLPIVSVVIAREHAKLTLLAEEPERIEVVESECDWWRPISSDEDDPTSPKPRHKVSLCVKTEGSRTLWSHLSSAQREKLCEVIANAEGTPSHQKNSRYIEHKLNLTLVNCSLTLTNKSKEVLVINLTQFLMSLETRPSAKAYKISARAESILIEGLNAEQELVGLLVGERATPGSTATSLLSLDVERSPLLSGADYGLCCVLEPTTLHYDEHATAELLSFFQTPSMSSRELARELNSLATRGARVCRSVLTHAVTRTKIFNVHVDVKGACLQIPERGCGQKSGRLLVLDIGRILVKSDLQPSNPTLEDATCMELEERLYDRLHAECTCQVLFCDINAPWRQNRKLADSDLHLMPKMKIQLVCSNSIKKDYKLLPRYKLNVSISSLKLNLSDRTISQLLSFMSAWYPSGVASCLPLGADDELDLRMDRVPPDPPYEQLLLLRSTVAPKGLGKSRKSRPSFDKGLAKQGFLESDANFISSEHSDSDMELYARSVDLPGFDDNVSPSNNIITLQRLLIGEIVINLSRSTEQTSRPYLMLSISKVCVDLALMRYGPAIQLCVAAGMLTDKQTRSQDGQYLELVSSDPNMELINVRYRKVRADCPDFRTHFHNVEQSLVVDTGNVSVVLHSDALRTMFKYLQYICDKIQSHHAVSFQKVIVPKSTAVWNYFMSPEADPPVPPGSTKFSYSVRASSVKILLCHLECSLLEMRIGGVESECVFRANDRMLLKLLINTLHVDELAGGTLYPALVWPDEDKILEMKYVRAAPRLYGHTDDVKANGEIRLYLGRLHVVLFCSVVQHLQQFLEPLIPSSMAYEAMQSMEVRAEKYAEGIKNWSARLSLVIEIHAPVLLLPQKPSSPNLLVLNMGDLKIENFFKKLKVNQEVSSPIQTPVIDNILVKLDNVTLCRAVMTLAGTLEVQEPILEPVSLRCDLKRSVAYQQVATVYRDVLFMEGDVNLDKIVANLGQQDLATIRAVWADNLRDTSYIGSFVPNSPVELQPGEVTVKKLQEFFAQGEPVRKESSIRCTLDGIELKLFCDAEEIISSPVRDAGRGLAQLSVGEMTSQWLYYSDASSELQASVSTLLVKDITQGHNPDSDTIFCAQASCASSAGISVRGPALVEVTLRLANRATAVDLRVDRSRLNLAPAFLLQLLKAMPPTVDKTMAGGVINHGYVGDPNPPRDSKRSGRTPSASDCTSGYYSTATSAAEETPGLSISIQFRQPEIMLYTDMTKTEGHALLIRTELLVDYSCHSNTENCVISLAGLQVMSKLRSKLRRFPAQMVLRPCDVEFSKSFKNLDEGEKVALSVSEIDLRLAPTTVHIISDIIDEVITELTIPEDKEPFQFNSYTPRDKPEDLWSPRALTAPSTVCACSLAGWGGDGGAASVGVRKQTCVVNVPAFVARFMNVSGESAHPLILKMSAEVSINNWSHQLHGSATFRVHASCYLPHIDSWESLLDGTSSDHWQLESTVFQAKAYPISSKLDTSLNTSSVLPEQPSKKAKKRSDFESETSADEADDTGMMFIKNPNASEHKSYGIDWNSGRFLSALDCEDDDEEKEDGLMDKLATAVGHLFTDDSSPEGSNAEDSSEGEQSEVEVQSEKEDELKSITTAEEKKKKKEEHKTVTLQEPVREDSIDSGLDTECFVEKMSTYMIINGKEPLNLTITPHSAAVLSNLLSAFTNRQSAEAECIVTGLHSELSLVNDVGPGSTVQLISRSEKTLAGEDRIIVTADYDADTSRPSTPGLDSSVSGMLDEQSIEIRRDVEYEDEWKCSEEFSEPSSGPTEPLRNPAEATARLYDKVTEHRLRLSTHDLDDLVVLCPQRSTSKLHVLHPSKNGTRYYVVVEKSCKYNEKKIVVRSPLQIRNETCYTLELYYKKTDLQAVGMELVGEVNNPFADKMRLGLIPPDSTYNVPLYIAYHCKLFLLPSNFESYQTATQGIWWMELANNLGTPRDVICPAKADDDPRIFGMRILTVEGVQSPKSNRAIPNYLIRVLPPLAIYNRLPYALEVSIPCHQLRARIEAGERHYSYVVDVRRAMKLHVDLSYMGLPWTANFTLHPDTKEKNISMSTECETDGGNKQVTISLRVERASSCQLLLHAPLWIINKTALPLQLKATRSDAIYEVTDSPFLWSCRGKFRVRAHQSRWSRAAAPAPAAPGLLTAHHAHRTTAYTMLLQTTLSELCPQLTKIVTILPYFLIYNDTKRHLRYMEENEAADLWMDLAPQQCAPFWPQTDSLAMHCKLRESSMVSQHFSIAKNHFTVLRMDKGSAIAVDVTGGSDRPFTITFKPFNAGDAPVRIDNLCDDLFLKLNQIDSGQVALLSPYQSLLYTWDDPVKERKLKWNIYNNKGKGFKADFSQDGCGEEKVSFHSVKHSTLVATNSVTSKLSSTLKRLTPKSPEPFTSSSDDSDSTDLPEAHAKSKKTRKDKVIVYWVSYMDGHQRVFALAQDERVAYQYRMKINAERSNFELYASLASVSLSVCVKSTVGIKELAYISVVDSLPRWEVNVSSKWKQLSPDLTAWIEDKYQTDQKKCQLKEYLDIDLEKMQMTKPFFSELRRTYNPGIWMQWRKSNTLSYFHLKLHKLQIDNQLNEAVFPIVLHQAPLPTHQKSSQVKPSLELLSLKQHRPSLNQDIYKFFKVLLQEHCLNLDRGFVNYVFDILNHWKIEEKPAIRLRADLALVHMPLPIIALKSQTNAQRNVSFEYVHLSPIKIVLSMSSRGYVGENVNSHKSKIGNKLENRPKLFNSDLLEYLFNSWGSSLCDMKDVNIRLSYLELRNTPITLASLLDQSYRHFWLQMVQQFYVLVLGLRILANPFTVNGDFTKEIKQYYEPHVGSMISCDDQDINVKLSHFVASLLGQHSSEAELFHTHSQTDSVKRRGIPQEEKLTDIPDCLMETSQSLPASVALALSGLIARPTFDIYLSASRQLLSLGAISGLRASVERSGGRLVTRNRLPRYCPPYEGVRPYCIHSALGLQLFALLGHGHYADSEAYLAHAHLPTNRSHTVLVSTQHIFLVRASGSHSSWHIEWAVKLDDLIGVPTIDGDRLVVNIKQDELVNYYSTDEKVIEVADSEVLTWLQAKIECALILAMEDKRCPARL